MMIEEQPHEHVTSVRSYVTVFLVLLVLTFTTVAVNYVDIGAFNIVIALGIALLKAALVVMVFMHVKWSNPLTKLFVFSGLGWLVLLIGITLSDYWSRGWLPLGFWW